MIDFTKFKAFINEHRSRTGIILIAMAFTSISSVLHRAAGGGATTTAMVLLMATDCLMLRVIRLLITAIRAQVLISTISFVYTAVMRSLVASTSSQHFHLELIKFLQMFGLLIPIGRLRYMRMVSLVAIWS